MSASLPWADVDDEIARQQQRTTAVLSGVAALNAAIASETMSVSGTPLTTLPIGRIWRRAAVVVLKLCLAWCRAIGRRGFALPQWLWWKGCDRMRHLRHRVSRMFRGSPR